MADEKKTLRAQFRHIRAQIPAIYQDKAITAATNLFVNSPFFTEAKHIACYLAVKDEFNCHGIIEAIWKAKKKCYVPVLGKDKELQFVQYHYGDALKANKFSILEPAKHRNLISPHELDIVITPLLAFDNAGHRLGTGGGFYDTTFEFLKRQDVIKPQMMGLAYAAQQADHIPVNEWDVDLNAVITEKELMVFGSASDN